MLACRKVRDLVLWGGWGEGGAEVPLSKTCLKPPNLAFKGTQKT